MIETGISFGGLHSYWDFGLILGSVVIPPASPKETFVDVPGADGSVDMTEAHGEVKYADRTGASFTFFMKPDGDLSEAAWEDKKKEVSNRLNGLRCDIAPDKDPEYYWQGRCKVNEYASNKKLRSIVVGARLAPYKLKRGVTRVSVDLTEEAQEVTLTNGRKTVCPTIICTGRTTIDLSVGGAIDILDVGEGTHKILSFQLKEGERTITVKGTGTVTFEYQEGDL